jgi:hypothetical protein
MNKDTEGENMFYSAVFSHRGFLFCQEHKPGRSNAFRQAQ